MPGEGKLVCIFGKRGSGKTNLIRENLENYPKPVAVIDVLGNFQLEDEDGEPLYPTTTSISEFIEWLDESRHQPDDDPEFPKIFVLMPSDPSLALDFVSSVFWEMKGGTLVLDEVDAFKISEAPCYDQVIRYGRNYDINMVTGCRRPAEISRNITAGANKIYVFQTQEPRDVDYFEETVLGTEAQKLPTLPKFHGLFVDYDRGTTGVFRSHENGDIEILEERDI